MRTSSVLIAASAVFGVSFAQFGGVPECARPCVASYTTGDNVAGCSGFDIHCICSNENFLNGIACCLADSCDEAGIAAAIGFAKGICATGDPPVSVPDKVVCNRPTSSPTQGGGSTTAPTATPTAATTGVTQAGSETVTTATPVESSTSTEPVPSSTSSGAAMMNMAGGSGVGLVGGIAAALVLL